MAETIRGGRYLVNGQWVDAEGRPIAPPAPPEKPKAPVKER